MQKLVTIYLHDSDKSTHGVQEHLAAFLRDGWEVVSMTPVGSSVGMGGDKYHSEQGAAKGWLAVLLRK